MSQVNTIRPPAGGPTKDEILAIALFHLRPCPDDTFADIGCGTGRVSIEMAQRVKTVHAIDKRTEATEWTHGQVRDQNLENITVHAGEASEILSRLDHLDIAFVGGSQSLDQVVSELARLKVRRCIITAVMLETLSSAISYLRRENMFIEVISAQISKSTQIGKGIMLKPLDPVYLIIGGCREC